METQKLFKFSWMFMALAVLSSPLTAQSQAEALPAGVPGERCGTLSTATIGTLCYTVTPGGGKVNAGGRPQEFSTIIQATEREFVIADVIVEVTSSAGDRSSPSINNISPGGTVAVVSQATDRLRELRQLRGELQAQVSILAGPALVQAQAKINALLEQEQIYENVVTKTVAAGQDAGKFEVKASARSRSCGWANLDTCGSWVEYNIYIVKRYVGDPIAAYNRAFAVAKDAQNTITQLVGENQGENVQPNSSTCVSVDSTKGWQRFNLPGNFTKITSLGGGWSVDTRSYQPVNASGHGGSDAQTLTPYNQYKFDQRFPFGALLMGSGQGVLWIQAPTSFNSPFGAVDMRINDADNALSDNGGSLQVCFGH
jgi:hypothetical protein